MERLCAVLAAFEMDAPREAPADESEWAATQWNWLSPYLTADAVEGGCGGDTVANDSLSETQVGGACGSGDILVRRHPSGPLEEATKSEIEELRQHEADSREAQQAQEQHDVWMWNRIEEQKLEEERAKRHQAWEDWAVRTEMDATPRKREANRFRLQVVVVDKDGNELATSDMRGPVHSNEIPQVNFVMSMETEEAALTNNEGQEELAMPNSDAETVPVQVPEPLLDLDLTELEDVVSSTLCREWFRLWCDNHIDDDMVIKKWGQQVLDTFVINRAMVEMDTEAQVDKEFVDMAPPEDNEGNQEGMADANVAGVLTPASSGANLGDRWRLPPGQALHVADDGSGVGWPGPGGDGHVRQWLLPRPTSATVAGDLVEDVAGDTTGEPSQVDPTETQLMDVVEATSFEPLLAVETDKGEGGMARSTGSTEGHKGQLDLKHWLK